MAVLVGLGALELELHGTCPETRVLGTILSGHRTYLYVVPYQGHWQRQSVLAALFVEQLLQCQSLQLCL